MPSYSTHNFIGRSSYRKDTMVESLGLQTHVDVWSGPSVHRAMKGSVGSLTERLTLTFDRVAIPFESIGSQSLVRVLHRMADIACWEASAHGCGGLFASTVQLNMRHDRDR